MTLPSMIKNLSLGLLVSSTILGANHMAHAATSTIPLVQKWDKTFAKSDSVTHQKVTFKNRYGITLAADLYIPKSYNGKKLAALAVGGPFGAVKEQSSGLYAQKMAEQGFVTIAFDPSYTGESSGTPRNVASPDINTEDFSAAIDYLGLRPEVDRNRIGAIGICGWGGMGLNAAAMDTRIKAVATTSMYDMSHAMGHGVGDGSDRYNADDRQAVLKHLNQQRWVDAEKGQPATANHDLYVDDNGKVTTAERILPKTLDSNPNPVQKEFFDYYRTARGFHKNAVNSSGAWTATTPLSFMNMPLLSYIDEISPRPILIIAGEDAHSLYFSKDAYQKAKQPKELVILPNTNHVDLYDRMDKIPFDKLTDFFNKNLK